jgi:hypothetical protein
MEEKTAVNNIIDKLSSTKKKYLGYKNLRIDYKKEIQASNEMFEKQIIDAYNEGSNAVVKDAQQYYNKNFKSE